MTWLSIVGAVVAGIVLAYLGWIAAVRCADRCEDWRDEANARPKR